MILARRLGTVWVTKVKGHATDADVDSGRVRLEGKHGNAEADDAADLGRRHQPELLIDTRRALLNYRNYWFPVMQQFHRFMIAISRVNVGIMGGRKKQRRTDIRVNVDLVSLPGPPKFLNGPWVQVNSGFITGSDVAAWPYSISILCKITVFRYFALACW